MVNPEGAMLRRLPRLVPAPGVDGMNDQSIEGRRRR